MLALCATWLSSLRLLLLIPLLERVRGLPYLRFSALVKLMISPVLLLVSGVGIEPVLSSDSHTGRGLTKDYRRRAAAGILFLYLTCAGAALGM